MLTPTQINNIAKASEYLSGNDIAKGALYGQRLNPRLNRIIYAERMALNWMLGKDSNYSTLQDVSNYVLWLCGKYWIEANYIINQGGGGQSVIPVTPIPLVGSDLPFIEVRKSDFSNGTDYVDERLQGKQLSVDGNWLGEKIISEGVDWESISGGGVRILTDGFNSQSSDFNNTEVIIRILIKGVIPTGSPVSVYTYDLIADTVIPSLPTGTQNQERTIIIKPNGFSYDLETNFIFPSNIPPQTSFGVNTMQIYNFKYIVGTGNVCSGQQLDIPI